MMGGWICVLILPVFIGISIADNTLQEYISSGFQFDSSQSVNGTGFTSTRSCIDVEPQEFQSHSSGGGLYIYESTMRLRNFAITDNVEDIIQKNNEYPIINRVIQERSIEQKEDTSFAYSPILLDHIGGFRPGAIKSLWADSTSAGNSKGAFMNIGFDSTSALDKEVHTKVSGFEKYLDILGVSSGTSNAGMKIDATFTGTERMGASILEPGKKVPTTMIDELYRRHIHDCQEYGDIGHPFDNRLRGDERRFERHKLAPM